MISNLVSKMMFRSFLADRDNRLVELCHSRTRARVPIGKGAHSSDVRKLAADYTREGSCSGKSPTKVIWSIALLVIIVLRYMILCFSVGEHSSSIECSSWISVPFRSYSEIWSPAFSYAIVSNSCIGHVDTQSRISAAPVQSLRHCFVSYDDKCFFCRRLTESPLV